YDFFCPRLGEEITNTFLAAAINGIYAGDIKQLSLRSCLPKIWDIAQNNNSLIRATISRLKNGRKNKSQIISFNQGLEHIIASLAANLNSSELRLNSKAVEVSLSPEEGCVILGSGEKLIANTIIVSTEAQVSANIIEKLDAK